MQSTELSLTSWFLAFYLIDQSKAGISSLELSRQLGVKTRHDLAAPQQDRAGNDG